MNTGTRSHVQPSINTPLFDSSQKPHSPHLSRSPSLPGLQSSMPYILGRGDERSSRGWNLWLMLLSSRLWSPIQAHVKTGDFTATWESLHLGAWRPRHTGSTNIQACPPKDMGPRLKALYRDVKTTPTIPACWIAFTSIKPPGGILASWISINTFISTSPHRINWPQEVECAESGTEWDKSEAAGQIRAKVRWLLGG